MTVRTSSVIRGASWIYAYRFGDRLLGFVALAVLARILAPEDFGLVAIAASVIGIIEGLSDFDVKQALIHSRDEDRELYDCAWTLSLARGALAALVMVSTAPFVADTRIAAILYVLAVSPLLEGLSNPRFVMFERELVYSKLAAQALAATVVSVAVTLFVALAYRSYWALVLGIVSRSLVGVIATYALKPYRPTFDLSRWREILQFSGWMSLATAISTLSMRTDRIIVGAFLGVSDAGAYYMTQRIGVLPTSELISPLQRILFPSFTQIASDTARLRRAVCESVNVLASLSFPAAFGFALVANDFVPLVLGAQWLSITPLLVVLVPFFGLRASLSSARPCVLALGRTRLMFRVSLLYALVHLPAFVFATARYGLTGAIWSIVVAGAVYVYLTAWLLDATLEISLLELAAQLGRPLASATIMVFAVVLASRLAPVDLFTAQGSWTSLGIKTGLGALVYGASQYALWRLAGRPAGFERRLLQALGRDPAT